MRLIIASLALGRVSGRAAEVFFFMVLALPWWALQGYDAYLGPADTGSSWRRTFRTAWQRGHDIRFLGVLLVISALNDTYIILANLDYLLPFYCTKPTGIPGFLTKAISPVLHLAVGYGFIRCRRWAFFLYLVYAAYGFTNGMVNLTCFGPGRIRNTLLARRRPLHGLCALPPAYLVTQTTVARIELLIRLKAETLSCRRLAAPE